MKPAFFPLSEFSRGVSIGLAICMFGGCEKPSPASPEEESKRLSLPAWPFAKTTELPVERTLTDSKGRVLEATIVGRSETHLHIVRKMDGLNAEVSLDSLSQPDREFAGGIAVQHPPKENRQMEAKGATPSYVKNRLEAIEKLETEIVLLRTEMEGSTNSMLVKSRQSTISKNEVEIARLKSAIERYQIENEK